MREKLQIRKRDHKKHDLISRTLAKEIISKEHIICVAINMEANLGLYFPFILKPKVSRTNTEVRGMDK